ncbi:MAG: hypothetical protein SGI77_22480 [Pirellulaceae bacterium]|nr:hypothetical protein [Pirellulaceae bacterium]
MVRKTGPLHLIIASNDEFQQMAVGFRRNVHREGRVAIEVVEFVEGCQEVNKKDTAEKMSSRRS